MIRRSPLLDAVAAVVTITWWLWPLLHAPAAWLRVTRERLSDFDSHLVPYLAIHQSAGAWFWDPLVGYGRPVAGDPLANVFDPVAVLGLIIADPQAGLGPVLWLSILLAALAAWLLAREGRCSRPAATTVALGFATSGFVLAHLYAGHLEFLLALPALPLAWLGARRLAGGRRGGVPLSGFAFALPVVAGGAYFAELGAVCLLVVLLSHALPLACTRRGRALAHLGGRLALAALLATGLSAIHLLPVLLTEPSIVRPPIDPFGGSQPVVATMRNWLGSKAFYDGPSAGPLLEGQPRLAYDWWESDAYVGPLPLALAAAAVLRFIPRLKWRGSLPPPPGSGRLRHSGERNSAATRAAGEALAITLVALCWVDARSAWSPFHVLLPQLPNALQLHVATRALGPTTLALFLLAGLALTALEEWLPRPAGTLLAVLLGAGCLAGTLATGRPVLAAQAAEARSLHGLVPGLPAQFAVIAVGPTVPQTAVAWHGHVVANADYPWIMPAEQGVGLTSTYADAWLVRRDVGLQLPAGGWGPPTRAPGLPPRTPAPAQLLLLAGTPAAHVAVHCTDQPCPAAPTVRFSETGNTASLCVETAGAATYRLPIAASPGWSARRGDRSLPLQSDEGLLALSLPAGATCATLRYLPPGFAPGALTTAATILVVAGLTAGRRVWPAAVVPARPSGSTPGDRPLA